MKPRVSAARSRQFPADTIEDRFDDTDLSLVHWFLDQAGSNDVESIGRFVTHMCTQDLTQRPSSTNARR